MQRITELTNERINVLYRQKEAKINAIADGILTAVADENPIIFKRLKQLVQKRDKIEKEIDEVRATIITQYKYIETDAFRPGRLFLRSNWKLHFPDKAKQIEDTNRHHDEVRNAITENAQHFKDKAFLGATTYEDLQHFVQSMDLIK
jgi:hypothetical protein